MEETKRKINSVNREPAMAFTSRTINRNVVEGKFLKFLNSPRREHYPCDDRVNEKEERVCDTGCDTIAAFAAGAADHGAGRSAATTGSNLMRLLAIAGEENWKGWVTYGTYAGYRQKRQRQESTHCDGAR
jgi:hypothetical protein